MRRRKSSILRELLKQNAGEAQHLQRDVGADMIFPEAITSEAELERCAREIRESLHFNRTGVSPGCRSHGSTNSASRW